MKHLKRNIETLKHWKELIQGTKISELLSASYQGVKRLFVLAYVTAADALNNEAGTKNNRKYFLPIGEIENYNVLMTDGRNLYDRPIDDLIKQYHEVKKVSIGRGSDYTTGCLLDCAYFKDKYIHINCSWFM